ncbi:MAG: VOC family protein [Acidobacteria bacterium]|nr:VOC family protein [Acidobacteriota bacterium]
MTEKQQLEETVESGHHGAFCWTEFAVRPLESCKNFYSEIFGWKFQENEAGGTEFQYLEFGLDPHQPFGGMFDIDAVKNGGDEPKPHSNVYIAVDDADRTAAEAVEAGGRILGAPVDLPGVGRLCQIEDPTGAAFFIIQPESKGEEAR